MAKFIIAYHGGGKPETPEQGKAQMAAWQQWLTDLGDAVIEPGNPIPNSKVVTSGGVAEADPATRMSGYTLVNAENMDAAIVVAQACPFLDTGGSLHVGQLMSMG